MNIRMKRYEAVTRAVLTKRVPVIIRLDGCAFHTLTRRFKKPFDDVLVKTMQDTMQELCQRIEGVVLGYTQSDEISLVLIDYQKITTNAWFDYEVEKLVSVSASMATLAFNKHFRQNVEAYRESKDFDESLYNSYMSKLDTAIFDSRAYNVPREEVNNYLLWRQNDATKNSIQATAQHYFTHAELQGLHQNDLQDMLFLQRNVNWNDFPTHLKRGSCCRHVAYQHPRNPAVTRHKWVVDKEIPIFSRDTEYVNSLINI